MKRFTFPSNKIHFRSAFTMLELTFVIVVLGILAALAMPRLERDLKQEAADNILSNIRYTQHLALLDYKHKFDDPKWQQRFWHIYFGTCEGQLFYTVGSDDNMESSTNARVDFNESAIDPSNGKHLWAKDGASCNGSYSTSDISQNIFIGKKYGVISVAPSGGCAGASHIAFDHLGRPYHGVNFSQSGDTVSSHPIYSGYMKNACTFQFTLSSGEDVNITIEPETGYAFISNEISS